MNDVYLGSLGDTEVDYPRTGTYEIVASQKEDIDNGDMYSASRNTLFWYNNQMYINDPFSSDDYNLITTKNNFLEYGVDDSLSQNQYYRTTGNFGMKSTKDYDVSASRQNKDMNYISVEKSRIQTQNSSSDYSRDDHFSIGTVYLKIPPTQISVTDEAHNYRINSLRSKGEVVMTSGRTTTRIDLEIMFNGLDQIENQLRPLVAQFKTTPFLPIESEYLKIILNPFDRQLVDLNYLSDKTQQYEEMQKRASSVNDLLNLTSQKDSKENSMIAAVKDMYDKGYIDHEFYVKLAAGNSYLRNPGSIPQEELDVNDFTQDKYGIKRLDMKKFIGRHITVPSKRDSDMVYLQRNLNEIDRVYEEISDLNKKSNDLQIQGLNERFRDRQIVGVLSQMAITTAPTYPETLVVRLSLYVFNYDPFTLDFAFISGYNNKIATPDITKCSLFIDWYTRRWLADRNDVDNPSLGHYTGDQTTSFTYVTKMNPIDEKSISDQVVQKETFNVDSGMVITGVSVSIKNSIQFLPILSLKNPTCQYLGSLNSEVIFTIECTSDKKLKELSKMIDLIRRMSRTSNRLTRNNFIFVNNELLSFLAMPYFMIDNYTVDTVPGNPGLYSITLNLVEYKVGQEKFQKLVREGVTSQEEIVRAARWMLQKSHDFMLSGGRANANNTNSQYADYYDEVADKRHGWFGTDYSVIKSFMNGVGSDTEKNKELRKSIESVCPKVKIGETLSKTPSYIAKETKEYYGNMNGSLEGLGKSILNSITIGSPMTKSLANIDDIFGPDYDAYSKYFVNSLNNEDGDDSFFNNQLDNVSQIIAIIKRDDVVRRILDVNGNSELNNYLNKKRDNEDLDASKEYCYPDLELPTYADLPNGFRYMNTNKEAAIPCQPGDEYKSIQSLNAEVDPDFFFYKGSLWGTLDKNNPTYDGVENGIRVYTSLAASNKKYRRTEALDESVVSKFLSDSQDTREDDRYTNQGDYRISPEEVDLLEGTWVDVINVVDGDTITVRNGDQDISVRLYGYDAPESKESTNKKVVDLEHAKLATQKLSSLVSGKQVLLYFGKASKDKYNRYLATVLVNKNGKMINVNHEMLLSAKELKLNKFVEPDNPLALEDEETFFKSHETYVKTFLSAESKNKIIRILRSADILGTKRLEAMGAVGKLVIDIIGGKREEADRIAKEDLGMVVATASQSIPGLKNAISWMNGEKENTLTNDINSIVAKGLFHPTNNDGLKRFDRDADKHIALVAQKIRESQKDNAMRMSRAFPTFRIYFIEEDMPEWGRYDDLYSYQSVASIDITKSRQEAADVAVITFFNTRGTLDRSLFGLYNPDGNYQARGQEEAINEARQETRQEQQLDEFILKPGTLIKVKMGYSSDPDLLDTAFTGMVAEVSGGDMITVVAQGFGVELLNPVPQARYMTESASAFKVLDRIITTPSVRHFGKVVWLPEETATTKKLFRRSIYNPVKKRFEGASWWRNWGGFRFVMGLADDTRNDNIWAPENSWLYNMSHGGYQNFITKDRTIWDVFREMTRRMPGYITTVVPFDNRATIYFGPGDFMYWYTDQKKDALRKWKIAGERNIDKDPDQKKKEMVEDYGFTKLDNKNDINKQFKVASNKLTQLINNDLSGSSEQKRKIMDLVDTISEPLSWYNTADSNPKESASFLSTTAQSSLTDSQSDIMAGKVYQYVSNLIGSGKENKLKASISESSSGLIVNIEYVDDSPIYVSKNGDLYDDEGAVNWYDSTKTKEWDVLNPSRKLIRNYHYKDSYFHIISNNIVAASQYLYNKVTVEFGLEVAWNKYEKKGTPPNFYKVSAQADDDIWPERIKEKIVQEKNARDIIVAWNYALGNLWEEMRKMYMGHLTILGDPAIKPYDYIMISDYFTEMFGPIEVEQVTHHFSPDTGFITTIVPNLVCYVNNSLQQGSVTVAGAYMDNVSDYVQKIRSGAGLYGVLGPLSSIMGNTAANVAFWATGLSSGRREPISFSPLIYSGRPYIAGIEGLRKTSIYEAVQGNITRFIIQKNRITDTMDEIWNSGRKFASENIHNLE